MNILDVKNSGWYDIKRKVDIAVTSYCLQVELMIKPLENDVAQCAKSKPPTEVKQANIHSFLLGFSFVVLSASAAVTAFSVPNSSVIVMSPLRRPIFVCFMAKGGFFGPSSVKRGRTHIVLL